MPKAGARLQGRNVRSFRPEPTVHCRCALTRSHRGHDRAGALRSFPGSCCCSWAARVFGRVRTETTHWSIDATQQATTQEQPVPVASVAPAREDAANEAAVDSPAEPVAAVAPPTPADLPQDSEPPAEFDEPPAEELPSQAALTDEPPSEAMSPPEPELAVPDARVPRARAEPPAPEAARTPQTAPAPRTPPTASRPVSAAASYA
jgi:hypothetical protein